MTDDWAELAPRFVAHYGSLRGAVRTHVVHAHLRAHLPPPPASIVDVGGGAGHQSLPLLRDGYSVTIVDPSPAMLAEAASALELEDPEVAGRAHLVQAAGETAAEVLAGEQFAGVLCHGVLMYVEPPEPLVAGLCALAAPGGLVSIVAKSVASLVLRPALQGNWQEALAGFDGTRQLNGLDVDTRADTVDSIEAMLRANGVEPTAWYGVRLFTDGWRPDEAAVADPEAVFAVELEASRRDPYRQL
ncbi:MAG TPA: methyltransferase domain-containing protein, partial [Mycobacteriales bacterium]|nr:methyltransferase domain-containing protein [Mycobacteriales bacterium]